MRPLRSWSLPHGGTRHHGRAWPGEAAGTGSARIVVDVGTSGPAPGYATLEAVPLDARRAGVPGHGMAARGGDRISRWLSVRTRTD